MKGTKSTIEFDTIERDSANLKRAVTTLEKAQLEATPKIDDLEKAGNEHKTALKEAYEKIAGLQYNHDVTNGRVKKLMQDMVEAQIAIRAVTEREAEIGSCNSENAELKEGANASEKELVEARSQMNLLVNDSAVAKVSPLSMTNTMEHVCVQADATAKHPTSQLAIAQKIATEKKIKQLADDLTAAKKIIAESYWEIDAWKVKYTVKRNAICDLICKNTDLKTRTDESSAALVSSHAKTEQLSKDLATAHRAIAKKNHEISGWKSEVQDLMGELEEKHNAYNNLSVELGAARLEIMAKDQALDMNDALLRAATPKRADVLADRKHVD